MGLPLGAPTVPRFEPHSDNIKTRQALKAQVLRLVAVFDGDVVPGCQAAYHVAPRKNSGNLNVSDD
jgi:hypothetical protein